MNVHSDVDDLVRRAFLKAVAISTAVVATTDAAADEVVQKEVDVAVVGAGLAGLTAARELRKHDVRVCVLEARDRVGGRTLDHPIGDGHVVEGGGQWTGPTQTQILALAKDLGVSTFKSYTKGKTILSLGGARLTVGSDQKSAELSKVQKMLDVLAEEVPLADPWKAKRAKEWDAITVADWLTANTKDKDTRESIVLEVETALGRADRTSLLWYLFYVHSAGGTKALNTEAQELRFRGGPQALSKKMAADRREATARGFCRGVERTDEQEPLDLRRKSRVCNITQRGAGRVELGEDAVCVGRAGRAVYATRAPRGEGRLATERRPVRNLKGKRACLGKMRQQKGCCNRITALVLVQVM